MNLPDILAAATANATGLSAAIPANWMQGRTAYGGLSAALALEAALRADPELPALRTAQISYVGPLAGAVSITAETLRRGRNATFVRADVRSEAGLGLASVFVFVRDQTSHIDHVAMPAPAAFPEPPPAPKSVERSDYFFENFEYVDADVAEPRREDWTRWVRLKERDGLHPMSALLAIGDALPPAAMGLATERGPISSMTWLVNLLTPAPTTTDGWWLLRSRADYARNGCSSQTMGLWNADGEPIASGMQSVAIFV